MLQWESGQQKMSRMEITRCFNIQRLFLIQTFITSNVLPSPPVSASQYDHGYLPLVVNTSRYFPHSWLITGCVTRFTWRLPLVEQELLTFPEHMRSPPVFSGVRVIRSFVLCVCFVDRCLSFCPFSVYGFWLPLWYLQTRLHFIMAAHSRYN